MRLEEQVALVTGGGSGIGRAIALALAAEGARVAVNDLIEESAVAVAEEIHARGGTAMAVPTDVADGRAVLKMFTRFLTVWDRLDIVVNNAGALFLAPHVAANMEAQIAERAAGGPVRTALAATRTLEDGIWRRTFAIHVDGTFHCTRDALKVMEVRRSGRIINMASIAGISGLAGSPDYSAAKAAIIGFTKAVAREVAPLGIRVNAIAPGFVETPLLAELPELVRLAILAQTPCARLGTPEEIAAAVLYLASPEADFMTGQVLSPNGGYTI
jgi:3-oxoacyl-[acyl-carrier protein] reductase